MFMFITFIPNGHMTCPPPEFLLNSPPRILLKYLTVNKEYLSPPLL